MSDTRTNAVRAPRRPKAKAHLLSPGHSKEDLQRLFLEAVEQVAPEVIADLKEKVYPRYLKAQQTEGRVWARAERVWAEANGLLANDKSVPGWIHSCALYTMKCWRRDGRLDRLPYQGLRRIVAKDGKWASLLESHRVFDTVPPGSQFAEFLERTSFLVGHPVFDTVPSGSDLAEFLGQEGVLRDLDTGMLNPCGEYREKDGSAKVFAVDEVRDWAIDRDLRRGLYSGTFTFIYRPEYEDALVARERIRKEFEEYLELELRSIEGFANVKRDVPDASKDDMSHFIWLACRQVKRWKYPRIKAEYGQSVQPDSIKRKVLELGKLLDLLPSSRA